MHERTEAADKVYAERLSRTVERFCRKDKAVGLERTARNGDGGHRNALVDYRNAVFLFYLHADRDETLCAASYLVIDKVCKALRIIRAAVEQGNAHCDGTYIEVFLAYHINSFEDIPRVYHS